MTKKQLPPDQRQATVGFKHFPCCSPFIRLRSQGSTHVHQASGIGSCHLGHGKGPGKEKENWRRLGLDAWGAATFRRYHAKDYRGITQCPCPGIVDIPVLPGRGTQSTPA